MNFAPSPIQSTPEKFVASCAAMVSREWGKQQITQAQRLKSARWLFVLCIFILAFCQMFVVSVLASGLMGVAYILFTIDKSEFNFADRLATYAKQKLNISGPTTIWLLALAAEALISRVDTVPTPPPRNALA